MVEPTMSLTQLLSQQIKKNGESSSRNEDNLEDNEALSVARRRLNAVIGKKHKPVNKIFKCNEKYVRSVVFPRENLEEQLTGDFKVLKISNCPNVEDALDFIDCSKLPFLFYVIIEACDVAQGRSLVEVFEEKLKIGRPWVVEIKIKKASHQIFYSDNGGYFNKITSDSSLNDEMFSEKIQERCDLNLALAVIRSGLAGIGGGSLFDTELYDGKHLRKLQKKTASQNALCVRYFKLFDLESENLIFETVKNDNIKNLLAYLDLPFENSENLILSKEQDEMISLETDRHENLLIRSIKEKNAAAVEFLSKLKRYDQLAASNCAWRLSSFSCLIKLLEADYCFPENFDEKYMSDSQVLIRNEKFHENIRNGELGRIKEFVVSNPSVKFAFNQKNQSALMTAEKSRNKKVINFLISRHFSKGITENIDYPKGSDEEEETNEDTYLHYLMSKTVLNQKSKNIYWLVEKLYQNLRLIEGFSSILEVVRHSIQLEIRLIFRPELKSSRTTGRKGEGETRSAAGVIELYLAEDEDFYWNLGLVAHELTHYAMFLVYKNEDNPYNDNDEIRKDEISDIAHRLQLRFIQGVHIDPLISDTFEFYEPSEHAKELIARAPQLLAVYRENPSKLKFIKKDAADLFAFYNKTIIDCQKSKSLIESETRVYEMNIWSKLLNESIESKIKFTMTKIKIEQDDKTSSPAAKTKYDEKVRLISSNAPFFSISMLCGEVSENFGSSFIRKCIFVRIDNMDINVIFRIASVFTSTSKPFLIIDCSTSFLKASKALIDLFERIESSERVMMVVDQKFAADYELNFAKSNYKYQLIKLNHKWSDLSEKTKKKFLKATVVNFQGHEMLLKKLFSAQSEALDQLDLELFIRDEKLEVGETIRDNADESFIPRKLVLSDSEVEREKRKLSIEDAIDLGEKYRRIIISDVAGNGKTTIIRKIASVMIEKTPDRFICLFELKQFVDAFAAFDKKNEAEVPQCFQDFMEKTFLLGFTNTDKVFFRHFYDKGSSTVILDGYDEICPRFKNLIHKLVELLDFSEGNQLWITTRPHMMNDVRQVLNLKASISESLDACSSETNSKVISLDAISQEEQINYLAGRWREKKTENSRTAQEVVLAISKLTLDGSSPIGCPLLLSLVAKCYEGTEINVNGNFSTLKIFETFVEHFLIIWRKRLNEISEKEQIKLEMDSSVKAMKVHTIIAMKYFFPGIKDAEDGWSAGMISRVGLANVYGDHRFFIHETFAEYFAALYVLEKVEGDNPISDFMKIVFIDPRYRVIRIFLNELMESRDTRDKFDELRKYFYESNQSTKILGNIVNENLLNILNVYVNRGRLLELLKVSDFPITGSLLEEKVKLVKMRLSNDDTLRCERLMKTGNAQSANEIEFILSKYLSEGELSAINSIKVYKNISWFHFILFKGDAKVVRRICYLLSNLGRDGVAQHLLRIESENFPNALSCVVCNSNDASKLKELIDFARSVPSIGIEKIFKKKLGIRIPVVSIFKHESSCKNLKISCSEKCQKNQIFIRNLFILLTDNQVLSHSEISAVLSKQVEKRWNSFHFIVRSRTRNIVLCYFHLLGTLPAQDVAKIVLQNDNGKDALNALSCYKAESCILRLLEDLLLNPISADVVVDVGNSENIVKIRCEKNVFRLLSFMSKLPLKILTAVLTNNSIKFLHILTCHSTEKCVLRFLELLENLPIDQINKIITQETEDGLNYLYFISNFGTEKCIVRFLDLLEKLPVNSVADVMTNRDNENRNALHILASYATEKSIIKFINLLEKLPTNIIIEIVTQRDIKSFNALHVLAFFGTQNCILRFFDILEHLSTVQITDVVTQANQENESGIHFIAKHTTETCISRLFYLLRKLPNNQIAEIFLKKNEIGLNFFHILASRTDEGCILKFLILLEKLSKDQVAEMVSLTNIKNEILTQKDNDGFSVMHLLVDRATKNSILQFIHLLENLTVEQIAEVTSQQNQSGSNALHIIAFCANEETLNRFLLILKKLPAHHIAKIFLPQNNNGSSSLHILSHRQTESSLIISLELLEKLSVDEKLKLFTKIDSDNCSVLHLLARRSSEDNILHVLDLLGDLSIRKVVNILTQKDASGLSVLYFLAERTSEDCFLRFLHFFGKLSLDQLAEVALEQDENGQNILLIFVDYASGEKIFQFFKILEKLSLEQMARVIFENEGNRRIWKFLVDFSYNNDLFKLFEVLGEHPYIT